MAMEPRHTALLREEDLLGFFCSGSPPPTSTYAHTQAHTPPKVPSPWPSVSELYPPPLQGRGLEEFCEP